MRFRLAPLLILLLTAACSGGSDRSFQFKIRDDFTLARPVRCAYREGQSMTDLGHLRVTLRQKPNSKPLIWEFSGLYRARALVRFGETEAEAIPYVTTNSISLITPRRNGVHIFTVWGTGISIWTKHDTINGLLGANQLLGLCENYDPPAPGPGAAGTGKAAP
jgi:hypothetical protein